jgi:oxalate decarboxylase
MGGTKPVIFRMSQQKPTYENSGGNVRVAAAVVTVKPGSMRDRHWHPNADE